MSRAVAIVPHTHWDREWHRPFEAFQLRLVEVLDEVLETLESDDRWEGFHFDGQVAGVEDYLELRPQARERFRKLTASGRLTIGPLYVLMDEFCVSGETILRNLELGIETAAELGGSSPVGYLPDMFGHIAQMPQLLRLAGITQAVVWRGVPSSIERNAFRWAAPDGSEVRAEYLPTGYASGAFLPDDPRALVERIVALSAELGRYELAADEPLLVMNGTDHQPIQTHLPATVDASNELQSRYRLELTTLVSYLSTRPAGDLPVWSGELRSGARAPILMGVLSNRRDLKLAAASTERSLEAFAEPLSVLWMPAELWPAEALRRAWLEVVRNSAHDSICGCSVDEVGRAVLHRYDTARATAAKAVEDALAIAAVAMADAGQFVINPSPRPRSGLVELTLPDVDAPAGTQQVAVTPGGTTKRTGTGRDLGAILGALAHDGWIASAPPTDARVARGAGAVELVLSYDASGTGSPGAASVVAEAWALAGADPDGRLEVTANRSPSQVVLAHAADVPGFGWSAWSPGRMTVDPVEAATGRMTNSLVTVEVDPSDGTFALDGQPGFGRIIDEGDAGDSYNYCPPVLDTAIHSPAEVAVALVEAGPLRGRIRISSTYRWPGRLEDDHRSGAETVAVTTDVELRAGERFVRIGVSFDNRCRDHRVRTVVPLPSSVGSTTSECAFATVERSRAEGGPREAALATFPSRRFVRAGGLTVLHDGLLEHELIEDGRSLALTILRSTGVLSKPILRTRPNSAGPPIALTATQMLGPVELKYAVARGDADPWALAEDFLVPLPVVRSTGTGTLPARGSRLELTGARVSALRRRHGSIEVRVFNPEPLPAVVHVPRHRGSLVDLAGDELDRWDGHFELGPWEVANARLDASSLD